MGIIKRHTAGIKTQVELSGVFLTWARYIIGKETKNIVILDRYLCFGQRERESEIESVLPKDGHIQKDADGQTDGERERQITTGN